MSLKGIDVSKHNGTDIDFSAVKSAGYDFVILRAGYGKVISQKDSTFELNYDKAIKADMHIGAYWYSYAKTVADAQLEAECFLQVIKDKQFDYPVSFDLEEQCQDIDHMTKSMRTDIVCAFLDKLQSAGYYAMLYCHHTWNGNTMLDTSRTNKYDTWVADIWNKAPEKHTGIWQNAVYGTQSDIDSKRAYMLGAVPGVTGQIDTDIAYKDYPSIIKNAGLNGYVLQDEKDKKIASLAAENNRLHKIITDMLEIGKQA